MPPAFMIARGSPVSPSNSETKPWCESRPRALFPGKIVSVFSDQSCASPPRCAGISPMQARLVLGAYDEAQRVVHLAARERRERSGHQVDALRHRQEAADVVLVEDPHVLIVKNPPIFERRRREPGAACARSSTGSSARRRFGPADRAVTPAGEHPREGERGHRDAALAASTSSASSPSKTASST